MAQNEQLANRIREMLAEAGQLEEKTMFGGLCFMLNSKMCICVNENEILCRIGPDEYEHALTLNGCREMDFTGRPMKGYVFVENDALRTTTALTYWVEQCIAFNKVAKASTRKINKQ